MLLLAEKLYWPFYMCMGASLGPGTQFFSWVTLHDVVRAIEFVMRNPEIQGAINVCAPNPVTNDEFTRKWL